MVNDNVISFDSIISDELAKALTALLKSSANSGNASEFGFGDFGKTGGMGGLGLDPAYSIPDDEGDGDNYSQPARSQGQPRILNTDLVPPVMTQDADGNIIFGQPRETMQVIRLKMDDIAPPRINPDSPIYKAKKRFFKSAETTTYIHKRYWDTVLQAIDSKFKDRGLVNRIAVVGSRILVNKKLVPLDNLLGGEFDIAVEDLLDIQSLVKRYNNLRVLILDSTCVRSLIVSYGSANNAVLHMFDIGKRLQIMALIPTGSSFKEYIHLFDGTLTDKDKKNPHIVTREDVQNGTAKQKAQQSTAKETLKTKMNLFGFAKNPDRLAEKSPGVITRFGKLGMNFGANIMKDAKCNFSDNKKLGGFLLKGSLGALLAVVGGGVTLAGSTISGVASGVKSIFNEFGDS